MKKIKNKAATLVYTIILTLTMATNVYADSESSPLGSDSGSIIMIIFVVIVIALAVFAILKDMHNKK